MTWIIKLQKLCVCGGVVVVVVVVVVGFCYIDKVRGALSREKPLGCVSQL